MGKEATEEMKNKKAWYSIKITPGMPFMGLLATSRVVQRMNSDSSRKDVEVTISDASVPGEGEH